MRDEDEGVGGAGRLWQACAPALTSQQHQRRLPGLPQRLVGALGGRVRRMVAGQRRPLRRRDHPAYLGTSMPGSAHAHNSTMAWAAASTTPQATNRPRRTTRGNGAVNDPLDIPTRPPILSPCSSHRAAIAGQIPKREQHRAEDPGVGSEKWTSSPTMSRPKFGRN